MQRPSSADRHAVSTTLWTWRRAGELPQCSVLTRFRTVTSIDRSRSCPQECAQPGEISCRRDDGRSPGPDRRLRPTGARAPGTLGHHAALTCADALSTRHRKRSRRCQPGRFRATPHGCAGAVVGERGATAGEAGERRRRRCTAVELSTCRHSRDGDHPQRANRATSVATCGKRLGPQLPHL